MASIRNYSSKGPWMMCAHEPYICNSKRVWQTTAMWIVLFIFHLIAYTARLTKKNDFSLFRLYFIVWCLILFRFRNNLVFVHMNLCWTQWNIHWNIMIKNPLHGIFRLSLILSDENCSLILIVLLKTWIRFWWNTNYGTEHFLWIYSGSFDRQCLRWASNVFKHPTLIHPIIWR